MCPCARVPGVETVRGGREKDGGGEGGTRGRDGKKGRERFENRCNGLPGYAALLGLKRCQSTKPKENTSEAVVFSVLRTSSGARKGRTDLDTVPRAGNVSALEDSAPGKTGMRSVLGLNSSDRKIVWGDSMAYLPGLHVHDQTQLWLAAWQRAAWCSSILTDGSI